MYRLAKSFQRRETKLGKGNDALTPIRFLTDSECHCTDASTTRAHRTAQLLFSVALRRQSAVGSRAAARLAERLGGARLLAARALGVRLGLVGG